MPTLDEKLEKLRSELKSDPEKRKKFVGDAIKALEENGVEIDDNEKSDILKNTEREIDDDSGEFKMARTIAIITILNRLA